jgi:hypothetical protein
MVTCVPAGPLGGVNTSDTANKLAVLAGAPPRSVRSALPMGPWGQSALHA